MGSSGLKYKKIQIYYFSGTGNAEFALLFPGYRILHQLLRIKLFNRIITLTSLTHFKWWNRYKYKL